MYYKIVNKESEVYQKLHEMRTKERQMEDDNKQAIAEKTGLEYTQYIGRPGQQTFNRVSVYSGFKFTEPEKVDLKIWTRHKTHNDIFVPNKRTNAGREMAQFLSNGLKGHWFKVVYKILGLEGPIGSFSFPFVEIYGDVIGLFIGDEQEQPADENLIEITSKEFESLRG